MTTSAERLPDDGYRAAPGAVRPLRPAPEPPPPVDGRRRRGQRTRHAIVEAYLDLVAEGDPRPSVERVAERAGTGVRTVYNQFRDTEALRRDASHAIARRLGETPSVDATLPFEPRLERFVAQRTDLLERLHPYAVSALAEHGASPQLRADRRALVDAGLAEIGYVFATELARLDAREREQRLLALQAVAGWPHWYSLRHELALDVGGARRLVADTIRRLLGAG